MARTSERRPGKKLFSGAFFASVGAIGFVWAQQYQIGMPNEMGPGYFPAALGILMMAVGFAQATIGLLSERPEWPIRWPELLPLLLILLSVVSYGVLIERAGLVAAIFAAVLFACFQRALSHPVEVFLTFAVLAAFSGIVFVHLFGMPIALLVLPE